MVKYYTYTDRTVRYTNRCNNKFRNETASEIKKKNEEISSLRRANVETMNKVKRTLSSYNFIYKNYSEIYGSYEKLLEENAQTKQSNENLVNQIEYLTTQNSILSDSKRSVDHKNEELNTFIDELEQKYLELLDDYTVVKDKCNEKNENEYKYESI